MNTGNFLLKITDKWPAKVLSIAAALIISIFYRLNTLETRVITVPLKVEITNDFIPVESLTQTVRVTIRGEPNSIQTITEDDIEAYINLNKYEKEGTYRVPIQIRKTGNALGAESLEISVTPSEINLTLEEKISRYIYVYPAFSGTIASGFEIVSQSITPESVIASGPRSGFDNLNEFYTEPIDMEGRSFGFTMLARIKNDNPDITIHGNRMIEYNCAIRRIERVRAPVFNFIIPNEENEEDDDEGEEE